MKEEKMKALYNQFIAIRGVVDTALYLLHEELYGHEEDPVQDQKTMQETCMHKDVKSFTTLGGPEHWICRDCGFEYREGNDE